MLKICVYMPLSLSKLRMPSLPRAQGLVEPPPLHHYSKTTAITLLPLAMRAGLGNEQLQRLVCSTHTCTYIHNYICIPPPAPNHPAKSQLTHPPLHSDSTHHSTLHTTHHHSAGVLITAHTPPRCTDGCSLANSEGPAIHDQLLARPRPLTRAPIPPPSFPQHALQHHQSRSSYPR